MNYWFLITGILILISVSIDLFKTSLSGHGAGIITKMVAKITYNIIRKLYDLTRRRRLIKYSGLVITLAVFTFWISLVWIGNYMIFLSDVDSVINDSTKINATWKEKFYYVGYTISTLGYGDFVPRTENWKIYASLVSLSGLITMTVSISYIVPVIEAVSESKILAFRISKLGQNPYQIITNYYKEEKGLQDLLILLENMDKDIIHLARSHTTYPVLHYYNTEEESNSSSLQLTILDEALTIIFHILDPEVIKNRERFYNIRQSVTNFLKTVEHLHITPDKNEPYRPVLGPLKSKNIPIAVNDVNFKKDLQKRRSLLKSIIEKNGWEWKNVYAD